MTSDSVLNGVCLLLFICLFAVGASILEAYLVSTGFEPVVVSTQHWEFGG